MESFGENGENFTIVSVVFEQIVKKMSPFKAQFNLGSILSYLVKATVLPLDYVSVVLFKSRQCFSSTDVTMQSKLEHFVDEQFHTIFIHLMVVLHCNWKMERSIKINLKWSSSQSPIQNWMILCVLIKIKGMNKYFKHETSNPTGTQSCFNEWMNEC